MFLCRHCFITSIWLNVMTHSLHVMNQTKCQNSLLSHHWFPWQPEINDGMSSIYFYVICWNVSHLHLLHCNQLFLVSVPHLVNCAKWSFANCGNGNVSTARRCQDTNCACDACYYRLTHSLCRDHMTWQSPIPEWNWQCSRNSVYWHNYRLICEHSLSSTHCSVHSCIDKNK